MALDIHKIRQTTSEALEPKGPERFNMATLDVGIAYWITYLEKEIERQARIGHRCAYIMLRSWDFAFSLLTRFIGLPFAFCHLHFAF